MRVLLDTSVLLYARGRAHPLRAPAVALLSAIAGGQVVGVVSVEAVQELVHVLKRRDVDRQHVRNAAEDVMSICTCLPLDTDVMRRALDVLDAHPDLGARDAIQLATAAVHEIGVVVTADRAWTSAEGLRVVLLADSAQILG